MSSDLIVAAGCLVTRGDGSDREVLLVHRPKYSDWSLPKGKLIEGEHTTQAAVREVVEETGVHVALRQPLPSHKYKVGGDPKIVHYWRAEIVVDEGFAPNSEVDRIEWLSIEAARKRLTRPQDGELALLAAEPASTPFVVLRHGHATKRVDWSGEDPRRPLDPAGFVQAEALVGRLEAYGLVRVHTSSATRCVQTVTPFAAHAGFPVVLEPELCQEAYEAEPDAAKARAAGLLADTLRSGQPTVLCGHRPYLPELMTHLLRGSGLTAPQDTVPVASMLVIHGYQQPDDSGSPVQTIQALEHHLDP